MITLYDYELSGNCYKIRLMLGFLGLDYTTRHVDFYPGLEHRSDAFRAINPLAQLPVLDHDGFIVRDAQAILTYLASAFDDDRNWGFGRSARRDGDIAQWLAFGNELTGSIGAARLHDAFLFELDADAARKRGRQLLRILDQHLWFMERQEQDWVVAGDRPSIADIACFPYVALSEDAGLPREECPAVRRWIDRFKRIEGFRVMSGVFPAR
ncbi:MAG: glutathione S-transferase family protein [Geminicoccaceae bacterium]|nr:glutathione S-transferase family protein [Geminicoccaceae bacterium]MCB9942004.1 glutathione S-transferase family protein [Geminicoccaceae bacterium]